MLTMEALEREVRRLAETNPDAEYRAYVPKGEGFASCWYTKGSANGQCGCLIGQAIRVLDPQMYKRIADYEEEQEASLDVSELNPKLVGFPEASEWLRFVQYAQDDGHKWLDCIKWADDVLYGF